MVVSSRSTHRQHAAQDAQQCHVERLSPCRPQAAELAKQAARDWHSTRQRCPTLLGGRLQRPTPPELLRLLSRPGSAASANCRTLST